MYLYYTLYIYIFISLSIPVSFRRRFFASLDPALLIQAVCPASKLIFPICCFLLFRFSCLFPLFLLNILCIDPFSSLIIPPGC